VSSALLQSQTGNTPAGHAQASHFHAHLLGPFRLAHGPERQNCTPQGRKTRALLAYLLLVPGRQASRDRLAGLLWSDRSEDQAKTSLRQSLAELRRHTGDTGADWLDARRDTVIIQPGTVATDIERTEAAAMSGDLATVLDGVRNWTEEVMSDLSSLDQAFDDWLYGERARRTESLVTLIGSAVRDGLERGEVDTSRDILRRLLALDPANEMIGRLALKSDYLAQDIAALHRHYRQLSDYLTREFQAKPSVETSDLFHELSALRAVRDMPQNPALMENGAGAAAVDRNPPVIVLQSLAGLSGDNSTALALGLTDDIRTALMRYPDLRIVSADGLDARRISSIASASVASYRATGSVRSHAGQVRISFQLSDINDGLHIWSGQFDVDATNLLGTADEVVAKIIGAVAPAIEQHVDRDPPVQGDGPHASYALYLAGRQLSWVAKNCDEAEQAARYLEQAIAQSPKLAVAYPPLAILYNTDFRHFKAGHDNATQSARALELARLAVAHDRANPHAHTVLGWCQLRRQQWDQAAQSFRQALALNPHFADGVNAVGVGMTYLGELETAGNLLRRAFELNPFPRDEYFSDIAVVSFLKGNWAQAEEDFELARDEAPHYLGIRLANLGHMGRKDAAAQLAVKLRQQVASIWEAGSPQDDAAYFAWMLRHMPFRQQQHQDLVASGLRLAGFEI
jgi:DNA-binding SARP family transcriptional activator/Flp pilus assembly protein TadD